MRQKILRLIALVTLKIGLLPILLFITERWSIRRKPDCRPDFPFVERRKNSRFLILYYHRVNDERAPFFGGIPVKAFEGCMEILCEHFNVLPLEELVERTAKRDVPPRAVAITFDDGYRDNYENAFPILRQFGLPATIFLVTGVLDSQTILLWHDRVFDAFRRTNAESIFIKGNKYPLRTLTEQRIALNAFLRDLRMHNPQKRDNLIQQLIADLEVGEPLCSSSRKVSWGEIKEMSREKISFGAHTVTHPILTRMLQQDAVSEITTSKASIEEKLKSPVRLFAYPNGGRDDFNESNKQALKDAGFLCAVTTIWGTNDFHTDPFELRRVSTWNLDPRMFALKLGWYKFSS